MAWIKCTRCGYGIPVERAHTVGPGAYGPCVLCGNRMTKCRTKPLLTEELRKCYLDHCNCSVAPGKRECSDGHEQTPY